MSRICLCLFITVLALPGAAVSTVIHLDAYTPEWLIDWPSGFQSADYSFGAVPEGAGSNGKGLTVSLEKGEALILYGPAIQTGKGNVHIQCSVRTTGAEAAIALAGLNVPVDGSLIANMPANGADFMGDQWSTLEVIYKPKGGAVMPAIQAVATGNTPVVVYFDEIIVTPLNSLSRNEAGALLGVPETIQPTPSPSPIPALSLFPAHEGGVTAIDISLNGEMILTGGRDRQARLWNMETGELIQTFSGHSDSVWTVSLSADRSRAITGSQDKTARLWNISTGELLRRFSKHDAPVYSTVFFAYGAEIITGGGDNFVRLWETFSGRQIRAFTGHSDDVYATAYSPNGDFIISGGADRSAILWNKHNGAVIQTFMGHTDAINDVAYSSDGIRILTASKDGTARMWDIATRINLQVFQGHTGSVNAAAFSPDNQWVITAGQDRTVKLWRVITGTVAGIFTGHTAAVNDVMFSPDGQKAVSGSDDGTVRLWPLDRFMVTPSPTPTPTVTATPSPTPTATPLPQLITVQLPNLALGARRLQLALVPAGTFSMGSPLEEQDRSGGDWPRHTVTITKPFYLSLYEITQAQWQAAMGDNPSQFPGNIDHPVESVSWEDCQEWIEQLETMGLGQFRLPTEAEWEYACRAGTSSRFYWGEDRDLTMIDNYAWTTHNNGVGGTTKATGSRLPNSWGFFDMGGNVYEWCSDWWEAPFNRGAQIDPSGPATGDSRVIRGGAYRLNTSYARSAFRHRELPDTKSGTIGLRLAKSTP